MQVPSLEQFNALENQVQQLKDMVQKMNASPLYLEWVTLDQACTILLIKTRETVIKMCKDGKLEYKRDGKIYQINYKSIIAYNTKQTIS